MNVEESPGSVGQDGSSQELSAKKRPVRKVPQRIDCQCHFGGTGNGEKVR
jgi:hypothetical protein